MKSDTPDDLFVFPDSPSLGPNCVLLSSDADSVFSDFRKREDYFLATLPWVSDTFFDDDLPF